MEDIKIQTEERIQSIDFNLFCDTVEKLESYGVKFYNQIRYELCDFLSAVTTIFGFKNMGNFMAENK